MRTLTFIVPAVPVAQPRPRATVLAGHARVYGAPTSHPVHAFKASVRLAARNAYDGPPLQGPIHLSAQFFLPRPKAMIWKSRPMPRVWHTKKPDKDNLEKSLCDALAGLLFVDDCQVCGGFIDKFIAAGDEQPHVRVTVAEIEF